MPENDTDSGEPVPTLADSSAMRLCPDCVSLFNIKSVAALSPDVDTSENANRVIRTRVRILTRLIIAPPNPSDNHRPSGSDALVISVELKRLVYNNTCRLDHAIKYV